MYSALGEKGLLVSVSQNLLLNGLSQYIKYPRGLHSLFLRSKAMSRFESNLIELVSGEVNDLRRSVLSLRLAAYRARTGATAMARLEIARIRERCSDVNSAQLFANINFAEAMCEFIDHGVQGSLNKLNRSRALSVGCPKDDELPLLISSWLANSYRILGDWDRLGIEISRAIEQLTLSSSGEGLARISIVLADCFQEVEDYRHASRWYEIARNQALACGDDSALSAILYNRSAIRVFNIRIAEVIKGGFSLDDSKVIIEAASAENYDLYSNKSAMLWVFGLLRGQLSLLRGGFGDALVEFCATTVGDLDKAWPSVDLVRRADIARCKAEMGDLRADEYVTYSSLLDAKVGSGIGWGDLAIAHYSMSKAAKVVNEFESNKSLNLSRSALDNFLKERKREIDILDALSDRVDRFGQQISRLH